MEDEEAEASVCGLGFGGSGAEEDHKSAKESDMFYSRKFINLVPWRDTSP